MQSNVCISLLFTFFNISVNEERMWIGTRAVPPKVTSEAGLPSRGWIPTPFSIDSTRGVYHPSNVGAIPANQAKF